MFVPITPETRPQTWNDVYNESLHNGIVIELRVTAMVYVMHKRKLLHGNLISLVWQFSCYVVKIRIFIMQAFQKLLWQSHFVTVGVLYDDNIHIISNGHFIHYKYLQASFLVTPLKKSSIGLINFNHDKCKCAVTASVGCYTTAYRAVTTAVTRFPW